MPPPKALVIEDSSVVRRFMCLQLECRGWAVAEAVNAHEGLKAFLQIKPQLITLDLVMPTEDDFGALQLARFIQNEDPRVTLLVVSSFAANPEIKDFLERHQLELFEKPGVDNPGIDRLLARVDSLFEELSTPPQ
jgi:CheY-like chemotaxis protein